MTQGETHYLHPDMHGKGIGTVLLLEGLRMLPNLSALFICVEKENKLGLHFYQAKGFVTIEEFDGHLLKTIKLVKQLEKV